MGAFIVGELKYTEELELLDKYLCGDKDSGEKLFGSAYPCIKKYVFARTKSDTCLSESDKEDIILEAMKRAVDNLHLYNGSSKFQTFIIGYAKNIILEQRRKKVKESKNVILIDDVVSLEDIDLFSNPIKVIIKKEELEAVQKALDMLSVEQKTVLILRLFNGMSFKQLASFVDKSDAAVDSLFRRSIKTFKNNFTKVYNCATDF